MTYDAIINSDVAVCIFVVVVIGVSVLGGVIHGVVTHISSMRRIEAGKHHRKESKCRLP